MTAILAALADRCEAATGREGRGMSGFEQGATAMREAVANFVVCGCGIAQRTAVVAAATTGGENCAARWMACGQSNCLALLAAEILDIPTPTEPTP